MLPVVRGKHAMLAGMNGTGEVVCKPLRVFLFPAVNQSMVAWALIFWCRVVTYILLDCGGVKQSPCFLSIAIGIAYSTGLSTILSLSFGSLSVSF